MATKSKLILGSVAVICFTIGIYGLVTDKHTTHTDYYTSPQVWKVKYIETKSDSKTVLIPTHKPFDYKESFEG